MSFSSLLRQTGQIVKYGPGSENEFGEFEQVPSTIATIKCRLQELRAEEDEDEPGETDRTRYVIFTTINAPVEANSEIWISSQRYRVLFPEDAAGQGHHLEIECERIEQP